MISLEFTENGTTRKKLEFPNEWDEMTAAQVRFIFQQYELLAARAITNREFRIRVVYNLLGLGRPSLKSAIHMNVAENVARLCEHLDFLFNEGTDQDEVPALSFNSVQNALPTVRLSARTFIGPSTLCQDLTFGEFRNAALALNTFFRTEDNSSLDECIAHLYRPAAARPNKAGRKVKAVKPSTFEQELALISKMAPWQKNLIMLWFASCIHFLQNEKITISGEDIDMKMLFTTTSEDGASFSATWNDLLVEVAREGTLGTAEEVDEAPFMFIILLMWTNYKGNKRNERKFNKANKS